MMTMMKTSSPGPNFSNFAGRLAGFCETRGRGVQPPGFFNGKLTKQICDSILYLIGRHIGGSPGKEVNDPPVDGLSPNAELACCTRETHRIGNGIDN
jgi:hypothetical protein